MKKLFSRKKILLFLGIAFLVFDLFWVTMGVLMLNLDLRGGSGSLDGVRKEDYMRWYDMTSEEYDRYKIGKEYAYSDSPYKRPYLIRHSQREIILNIFE